MWELTSGCNIPDNAIRAGYEENGGPCLLLGNNGKHMDLRKMWNFPNKRSLHPLHSKGIFRQKILVYPKLYEWKLASDGNDPGRAVKTDLYVGRTFYSGSMIPCKISTCHKCAFFGYIEEEHITKNYEVLCHIK